MSLIPCSLKHSSGYPDGHHPRAATLDQRVDYLNPSEGYAACLNKPNHNTLSMTTHSTPTKTIPHCGTMLLYAGKIHLIPEDHDSEPLDDGAKVPRFL